MKIKIDRKIFASALAEAAPFAPTKTPVNILKYAKVTTKGDRMKIEANDTQRSIAKYIPTLECDQDGSFLIEIAEINKFVGKTTGESIELLHEDGPVTIKHSKGSASFPSPTAQDYPAFKFPTESAAETMLPASILKECVCTAKNFVGTDDFHPQMKSIYAYIKDGEFGYCATDTRKMVAYKEPQVPLAGTDVSWYIDPSVFSAISSNCGTDTVAAIRITPTAVSYRIGDTVIMTAQAKGKFPDFNRVIPKSWDMECSVNRRELMDSLSRVSLTAGTSSLVKIAVSRMDMTVASSDFDFMRSAKETLTHNGSSGEIAIGMHAAYLLDCLRSCSSEDVTLCLTDAARPMLIRQSDKPNMTILIMPMCVS